MNEFAFVYLHLNAIFIPFVYNKEFKHQRQPILYIYIPLLGTGLLSE